jgi:hypothetical protein
LDTLAVRWDKRPSGEGPIESGNYEGEKKADNKQGADPGDAENIEGPTMTRAAKMRKIVTSIIMMGALWRARRPELSP